MSALEWRTRMPAAPVLGHDDGMVVVYLNGRAVVFPSEADARFFHASYADVLNLSDEVETLRAWIDEGALHRALAQVTALEAQTVKLEADKARLEAQLAEMAGRCAAATRRATVLTKILRQSRESL